MSTPETPRVEQTCRSCGFVFVEYEGPPYDPDWMGRCPRCDTNVNELDGHTPGGGGGKP